MRSQPMIPPMIPHQRAANAGGALWREHPVKGWQFWSSLRGVWRVFNYPASRRFVVAWEDTWAEPEDA